MHFEPVTETPAPPVIAHDQASAFEECMSLIWGDDDIALREILGRALEARGLSWSPYIAEDANLVAEHLFCATLTERREGGSEPLRTAVFPDGSRAQISQSDGGAGSGVTL